MLLREQHALNMIKLIYLDFISGHNFEVGKLIFFEQINFLTQRVLVSTGVNCNINYSVVITRGGLIYIFHTKLYSHFTKLTENVCLVHTLPRPVTFATREIHGPPLIGKYQ